MRTCLNNSVAAHIYRLNMQNPPFLPSIDHSLWYQGNNSTITHDSYVQSRWTSVLCLWNTNKISYSFKCGNWKND